jgi:hypothetical protein
VLVPKDKFVLYDLSLSSPLTWLYATRCTGFGYTRIIFTYKHWRDFASDARTAQGLEHFNASYVSEGNMNLHVTQSYYLLVHLPQEWRKWHQHTFTLS